MTVTGRDNCRHGERPFSLNQHRHETDPEIMCTEECGQLDPPDERELLEAFQIVTRDAFAFLAPEYDFDLQSLHTFNLVDGNRVPVNESGVAFPFFVELDYQGGGNQVFVRYGDRDYELGIDLIIGDSGRHSLGTWIEAMGAGHDEPAENMFVSSRAGLARHARRLAQLLRTVLPELLATAADVRNKLANVERTSETDKSRQRREAKVAFQLSDYEKVVELLDPLQAELTATEVKQLAFARLKTERTR